MTPAPGYVAEIGIRWVDLDAQGHVNNALIADYLQEARVAFLLSGPNAHLLGHGVVVVANQIEYLAPVAFSSEPVQVEVFVGRVGAAQFTIGYRVLAGGQLVARARTHLCIYDFDAGRPRRLSTDERAWFLEHSVELEPLRELGSWNPGPEAFVHDFVVRWSDLDSYGHVNNVRFLDYAAEARIRMRTGSDPSVNRMRAAAEANYLLLVVRQDVTYRNQLEHRSEPYAVQVSVAGVGTTSVTLVAHVMDPGAGTVFAAITTVLVCADLTGRPIPLPAELADGIERFPAVPGGRQAAQL
ncbi:MAG: thioesterase family protein [Micropruina sp.]|nr:thioesterase family protein [Micropruina sp.]